MLWTDSVVATQQPGIQVPEHDVDYRQVSFGFRLVALYSQRVVAISQFGKVVVAGPPICTDSGPWRYGRDNERLQLLSASSRRDFETKAASNKTSTVPTFVFGLRLPGRHVRVRPGSLRTRPDLDRAHNQRFVMAPPTFALRGATDPRLVQFDRPFATDSVTLRTNHRRSQFMQHLESGLVTSEPKLSLKLQSAHSGSLGCHKVGRPEPDVKRLSRALHDGPGREAGLAAAARAFKNTRTRQKPPRFSAMTTGRAFEAFRPADTFHVAGTGHLIGKILLEFQKSLRIVGHASDCVTGLNLWQPDRHGSFERHQDIENPDHPKALIAQRRHARDALVLKRFLGLTPLAEKYHAGLLDRRGNAMAHVRKIVALVEIHGDDAVVRAMTDALAFEAFSSEYIAHLIDARRRQLPEPSPLHLIRRQDLLEIELPPADLSAYPNIPTGTHPQDNSGGDYDHD